VTGEAKFSGWARRALPVERGALAVTEVRKPNVGEAKPAAVTCEVKIDLNNLRGPVREEWDQIKQHDVLFLLAAEGPLADNSQSGQQRDGSFFSGQGTRGDGLNPAERYGLKYVRGAEVIEVRDGDGKLFNDFTGRVKPDENGQRAGPGGDERTYVLALDTAQYQLDVNRLVEEQGDDVYVGLNMLMRRKPKENNFKAILECIRDLMNSDCVVPEWLHDIFLGYGDPAAAQCDNMPAATQLRTVDFKDTFLDAAHLKASFPGREVSFTNKLSKGQTPMPPFRVTFTPAAEAEDDGKKRDSAGGDAKKLGPLLVESYVPPDPGPYPEDQPNLNHVRFTPVQVEAIRNGVQPGLTMVVGPPGTGKTDTATQILHCLYHNEPGQRTLLITHSNAALNDLFQKLMQRDVPARYLLRLGQGEADLDTDLDFSRVGRVNAMLSRRLELLSEVEKLATCLGVPEDVAYTCETAGHFWLLHVLSRWEKFEADAKTAKDPAFVVGRFPFTSFFAAAPQPLFTGKDLEADLSKANGCMRHIRTMFTELEECRAFELLKGMGDRSNYLLTKQAKVVAMTCTHAALKRSDFLRLGFKYDNLVMEESAQILEIETFIPMLLQKAEDGHSRLKRVVLVGDHHQLPPVVKNMAFQKYCNMDQSLFTRFVRLGTPYIELNAQGRARPALSKLYNWRYRALGDLPSTNQGAYTLANPGFAHELQFVDVGDYNGVGETEPTPHFLQNLGEAEYLVSVFQYMRLLGYPASKISIITTYRGQKHLIRDVVARRCTAHPLFGTPKHITTVDKFQGQQNDYVLLSLVRTRSVGHLRDVRRLVVAMSRARLGLYVFGRKELFKQCYELAPAFKHLLQFPTKLAVVPTESYPTTDESRKNSDKVTPYLVGDAVAMGTVVNQLALKWQQEQMAAAAAMTAHMQQFVPVEVPQGGAGGEAEEAAGDADMEEAGEA
jgi:intron-binding protein aquarius